MTEQSMRLDELVRALSGRRCLAGLTPTTRTLAKPPVTATVIERMLKSLREQACSAP